MNWRWLCGQLVWWRMYGWPVPKRWIVSCVVRAHPGLGMTTDEAMSVLDATELREEKA